MGASGWSDVLTAIIPIVPQLNPVWMFTWVLLPILTQQQLICCLSPASWRILLLLFLSLLLHLHPSVLFIWFFVYFNLFSPFILTEPHTLFFGGQFFKLSCWFLQEVAAVPTRSQEPVVPPTLIAVSTFPICFLFPIKFSLFIKS